MTKDNHEGTNTPRLDKNVEVPLWAVLYAIRYGMNRASYASADAVSLANQFWDDFPDFIKEQFKGDLWAPMKAGVLGGPTTEVYERWAILFDRKTDG